MQAGWLQLAWSGPSLVTAATCPATLLQLHAHMCVPAARGFPLTTLLRVVRQYLQRHWFLYADSRSDALYKAIKTACLVTVQ